MTQIVGESRPSETLPEDEGHASVLSVAAPRSPNDGRLRVLTLNLFGRGGDWANRRSVLTKGIREIQPDLVAFQEVIETDDYDQVVDLLGPDFVIAHETLGLVPDAEHQGVSIASRWPLGNVREVDLHLTPRTADFPCTTLIAEIDAPDPIGPLLFVNHFPSWQPGFEYERELQTVAAARVVEELVGRGARHAILAGDFDAVPETTSIRFWTGRHSLEGMSVCYRDAWESLHPDEPGHTFSPRNPLVPAWVLERGRRIDYILVRFGDHAPTLDVTACELVFDKPVDGVWASDHFGMVADLAVPRQKPEGAA